MKQKIILLISAFILLISFATAEECIGQNCGANIFLNVTNASIPPIITRTITGQAIFDILDSSGAGLSKVFIYLGQSLPLLFFGIALVIIIVAMIWAILKIFRESKHLIES